jgi:hypothetical protein
MISMLSMSSGIEVVEHVALASAGHVRAGLRVVVHAHAVHVEQRLRPRRG